MTAQVKVWENSQGIRLPKNLREGNGVYLNDSLTIEVHGGNYGKRNERICHFSCDSKRWI